MMVKTGEVTNISTNSADISGQIIDIGEAASQYGHCYGKTPNVDTNNYATKKGKPTGNVGFTSTLPNLEAGMKYYVKAYLSQNGKTVYGKEISFNTLEALLYVSSVVENATPAMLEITYSLTLANIVPAVSAFTVIVNSVARTVNAVTISGTKVQLTLASAVAYGDIVTVAYNKPGTNPLQTPSGGQAVTLTAQSVTNNVLAVLPVYVSSVVENATPTLLEMTYNLGLANIVPAVSAFTVIVNSVARTVNAVTISGTKVQLTLASAMAYGDIVTVAYTKPGSNPLQTVPGGQASTISAQAVTNNVNPISPVYVSSVVENATPVMLEITYSLTLANIVPAVSAFTVIVNSVARTVNAVTISGTKVQLTLASAVAYGDIVTVAYTKPGSNPLQTVSGGQASTISAQTVTNNVNPISPVYVSSVVENATPAMLEITYNLSLANIVPAVSAFTVIVNSVARTVNAVTISGTKVQLTLASAVAYGDIVTVAYTKPGSNPLQTVPGGQASTISAQAVTNNVNPISPVYVSSVVENATPVMLEITYSLTLANIVPAVSAFTVIVNSVARTVNAVTISGTKVQLTLASAVAYGDIVTVAYTKPGSNPLQTVPGGQASTISAQAVTNNVNPISPVYVSSVVENATPAMLEITYSLTLANIVSAASAFTVIINSVARTVNAVTISGTKVQLTLASAVAYGDIVTVAYTKPGSNPLQTVPGGQASTISAQTVTNNVNPISPVYVSSVVENATPAMLEITYSLTLANTVPAASAFTVIVNSVARTVNAVTISGTKVQLTLASAVVYGNIVTVAYTKPVSNPLQTPSGEKAASIAAQSVTNNLISVPTITTTTITSITITTASCGGNITNDGIGSVTHKGVCWSTSPNPTVADSHTDVGSGTGSFVSNLTGLTVNTTYYVKAYATNSAGTGYGNEISFDLWLNVPGPGVTDVDGNSYNSVKIGLQIWMVENLKTTKYNDGGSIPLVTDNTSWISLTTPGYCWYNNDVDIYKADYGALYNWYTVNTGKLCPQGWHVSTDTEWTILTTYLGGQYLVGGKLKETGTVYWNSPNSGATNESGFTALPGGLRFYNGAFSNHGTYGNWWSATEGGATYAWSWNIYCCDAQVQRSTNENYFGFSVRCLKN